MDRGMWRCTGDRDQDHIQEKKEYCITVYNVSVYNDVLCIIYILYNIIIEFLHIIYIYTHTHTHTHTIYIGRVSKTENKRKRETFILNNWWFLYVIVEAWQVKNMQSRLASWRLRGELQFESQGHLLAPCLVLVEISLCSVTAFDCLDEAHPYQEHGLFYSNSVGLNANFI